MVTNTLIIIVVMLAAAVLWMTPEYFRNIFKVGYYEATLENHKDKFREEKWENIKAVMNDKWKFLK